MCVPFGWSSRADRVAGGLTAVVSSARWWSLVLLARMESAGGVPIDNRPFIGQCFLGSSPPRSDRFAIVVSLEAVLGGFSEGVYVACLSIVKSRSSFHTVHAMRAILLASATAALLCPRRFSTCSAQV